MRRRIGTIIALVVAGLAMAGATGWGALVLFYLGPGSGGVRTVEAWSFAAIGLAALGTLIVRRARRPAANRLCRGLRASAGGLEQRHTLE
jgi:hypothetical protein